MAISAWQRRYAPAPCAVIASASDGPERGVVDPAQRVFGYRNMLVCDGSTIPAHPGVNPSLTITAMSENAMAQVPAAKPGWWCAAGILMSDAPPVSETIGTPRTRRR